MLKRLTLTLVLFVASTTIAVAHHDLNLFAGIPFWQIVTVGVLLVLAFSIVTWVRRSSKRRRRALGTTREPPPRRDEAP